MMPPMVPVSQGSRATQVSHDSGNLVTNTNYVISLKKCWQASGHASIAQLLQAYTGKGTPAVPMMGDQAACLSWILKGRCFDDCARISSHKQASSTIIAQVHSLLDACGVAPSN